jgi:hypothetical protein
MCYQLPIAKENIDARDIHIQNCSHVGNTTLVFPNDTAKWFGLELTTNLDRFIGVRNPNQ